MTSHTTASSVAKAKRDQPDDEDVNYPSNRNGDLKCLERQVPGRHGARNQGSTCGERGEIGRKRSRTTVTVNRGEARFRSRGSFAEIEWLRII